MLLYKANSLDKENTFKPEGCIFI